MAFFLAAIGDRSHVTNLLIQLSIQSSRCHLALLVGIATLGILDHRVAVTAQQATDDGTTNTATLLLFTHVSLRGCPIALPATTGLYEGAGPSYTRQSRATCELLWSIVYSSSELIALATGRLLSPAKFIADSETDLPVGSPVVVRLSCCRRTRSPNLRYDSSYLTPVSLPATFRGRRWVSRPRVSGTLGPASAD